MPRILLVFSLLAITFIVTPQLAQAEKQNTKKPHAVFVIGTHHYSPQKTLPLLAEQLQESGFRTTVISPKKNPERKPNGIPGLEALNDADVAIFYMRFLTLPDDQLAIIDRYVKSGKPVVGFRTSSHAFMYPKGSPNAHRNDDFGKRVLGSKYFFHLKGKTKVEATEAGKEHPVLSHVKINNGLTASGSLYLSDIPKDAKSLLSGTGKAKKAGIIKNSFGTHQITETMTQDVAWTWKNEWGGRVFATSLGHPDTFTNSNFVRLFINGICWTADHPIPVKDARIVGIKQGPDGSNVLNEKYKTATGMTSKKGSNKRKVADAKNMSTGNKEPFKDPEYQKYGIYQKTAPLATSIKPNITSLPLNIEKGMRIALVGNTLFDRAQYFGHFEAMLHTAYPNHQLHVRNLAWSADTADLMPRPDNFANVMQHITHEKIDVVFIALGFNESFQGAKGLDDFKDSLKGFLADIKSRSFNGKKAPQVVLVSPIANENVDAVSAADRNNANIRLYADVMKAIAKKEQIGFIDAYTETESLMKSPGTDLTINGCHLNDEGYAEFSKILFHSAFKKEAPETTKQLRDAITDKNQQYFYRYRPLNTFYYVGGRSKSYGYLDFLPAMKNFDIMVNNREKYIWDIVAGKNPGPVDDSNLPPLPKTKASRGANQWITAEEELKSFEVDPRFKVNLFAGEEEFPDIAAPIQMRWDSKGRLWIACSTTYPHVYPGNKPNDKLVILEDTDQDGKADKSTLFADDLNIPLSFEFGDGGVYVSDEPHLTFIKDTDGDGRADYKRKVLTGFGTEDSHHALHDFAWSPDGDLVFRESIFHHTQVETPYGPVRQQNSGWFRYTPRKERLISFGTYHSTNPWGVTYDDWGQHVASHPIYAEAHHAIDPTYPTQHPKPNGLRAYSGTCGHEFVDMASFPDELQGGFIKARYKPTNRIEIHKWVEGPFGYDEEYVSDIIFSKNLSFIPVDLRYGPRGAIYVCDWYNPIKGHAQYSLRDERRDRHSGRIWRITAKNKPLVTPPKIDGASLPELIEILKRPEYRYRYWAKREIRQHHPSEVAATLDKWVASLDKSDPRFLHHKMEAVWVYRSVDAPRPELLKELLSCDDHHARAAATHQLRFWHSAMPDALGILKTAMNDKNGIVRMQAANTANYIDSPESFKILLEVLKHPREGHLNYAIMCSLGSQTMKKYWESNPDINIAKILRKATRDDGLREPAATASQSQFDSQPNLKKVEIGCLPERMKFTLEEFGVTVGQPVKIVFKNPDATDHNLLIVQPGARAEVGMAANAMAKDPKNASGDFIPPSKKHLVIEASPMIGPTRNSRVHVLRFNAPEEPGVYPFVCTFPGHWVMMKGVMAVATKESDIPQMLAKAKPKIIRDWKMTDFGELNISDDPKVILRGLNAFTKVNCHQCHALPNLHHGASLGPNLKDLRKRFQGRKLLKQIVDPSSEIHKDYRTYNILLKTGKLYTGLIRSENSKEVVILPSLLTPKVTKKIPVSKIEFKAESKISQMPSKMLNTLTETEIMDLLSYLESL